MSTQDDPRAAGGERPPTEEELRAAYEAELKRLRVEDIVLQTVVSFLNLGGRRAGLTPGTEDERDPEQVRLAIEATRALLPLIEAGLGPDAGHLRDALSQLQLAYTRIAGTSAAAPEAPDQEPPAPGPGEAQRSGRLWVPGQ